MERVALLKESEGASELPPPDMGPWFMLLARLAGVPAWRRGGFCWDNFRVTGLVWTYGWLSEGEVPEKKTLSDFRRPCELLLSLTRPCKTYKSV